jgi:hypothetical protein
MMRTLSVLLLLAIAAAPAHVMAECRPSAATQRVRVSFEAPAGLQVAGLVIAVSYPPDKLVIEGQGAAAGRSAVSDTPEGTVTASEDRDGELRQVIAQAKALAIGPIFEVTFHRCDGASAPATGEVSCRVLDASDPMSTKVADVRCSIGTAS